MGDDPTSTDSNRTIVTRAHRFVWALAGVFLMAQPALAQEAGTAFCDTAAGDFVTAFVTACFGVGVALILSALFGGSGIKAIAPTGQIVSIGNRMSTQAVTGAGFMAIGVVVIVWIFSYSSIELSSACVPFL